MRSEGVGGQTGDGGLGGLWDSTRLDSGVCVCVEGDVKASVVA